MTETDPRPDPPAAPSASAAGSPVAAPDSLAAVSPLRSALAVAVGFAANWFLGGLSASALGSILPAEFPGADPTAFSTLGLAVSVVAWGLNATVAGLLCGRLAPLAPIAHAGILAGLFGMFAMTGMDQAHGLPGWFALSFALVPPAGALLGGWLAKIGAERRARATRSAPRGAAEAISTEPTRSASRPSDRP